MEGFKSAVAIMIAIGVALVLIAVGILMIWIAKQLAWQDRLNTAFGRGNDTHTGDDDV